MAFLSYIGGFQASTYAKNSKDENIKEFFKGFEQGKLNSGYTPDYQKIQKAKLIINTYKAEQQRKEGDLHGVVVENNVVKPGNWTTNYELAIKESIEKEKPVYVLFTGSDWCGACIFMEKNIYTKKQWVDYAKENLILLYLDFPRNKKQSERIKMQNEKLAKEFKVDRFPTFFLINGKSKKE